jgi:hypothetical protein
MQRVQGPDLNFLYRLFGSIEYRRSQFNQLPMVAIRANSRDDRRETAFAQFTRCLAPGKGRQRPSHLQARWIEIGIGEAVALPAAIPLRAHNVSPVRWYRKISEIRGHYDDSRSSRSVRVIGTPCRDRGCHAVIGVCLAAARSKPVVSRRATFSSEVSEECIGTILASGLPLSVTNTSSPRRTAFMTFENPWFASRNPTLTVIPTQVVTLLH